MGLTLDTGSILCKGYDHSYIAFGKFGKDILIGVQIRLGILQGFHKICDGTGIGRCIHAEMSVIIEKATAMAPEARLKFQRQLLV